MDTVPDVLLSVVGGVLADTFDRRRLLIVVQGFLVIVGAILTGLTLANEMPPALLLTLTFLLGAGSAFSVPAYQAIIRDLVPPSELTAASALGSISINVGRAIGPAIAGILIAQAGVGVVFAINTATFLVFGLVMVTWHPPAGARPDFPERFISALHAGTQYVRHAPVVRRILARSTLFLTPASVLWALLPLAATEQLGLGSVGYGVLLGALGVGAIVGAFLLPSLRARTNTTSLLLLASIVYAVALMASGVVRNTAVVLAVLVPAGIAWVVVLSSVNAELQLFLPAWVRGRALFVYQTVLFGSQAVGALLASFMAGTIGLEPTLFIAAASLFLGAATTRSWPLIDTQGMDRSTVVYWPAPALAVEVTPDNGPVVVTEDYSIAPEDEQRFLEAMQHMRLSRLRTGATQWGLFRDGEAPRRFVELFCSVLGRAPETAQHPAHWN